jgi:hypothetical protein
MKPVDRRRVRRPREVGARRGLEMPSGRGDAFLATAASRENSMNSIIYLVGLVVVVLFVLSFLGLR